MRSRDLENLREDLNQGIKLAKSLGLDVSGGRAAQALMAVDQALADGRAEVAGVDGVVEKRMFGGLAFLLQREHGRRRARRRPDRAAGARGDAGRARRGHVRVFDMTGRPMKGWVLVGPGAIADEEGLGSWVTRGLDFAESLPPK